MEYMLEYKCLWKDYWNIGPICYLVQEEYLYFYLI
jgi:hypothetical protein